MWEQQEQDKTMSITLVECEHVARMFYAHSWYKNGIVQVSHPDGPPECGIRQLGIHILWLVRLYFRIRCKLELVVVWI